MDMKKRLIMITGTMGAGKSTTTRYLYHVLPNAVRLEGDWLWDADPYLVTAETKTMVMKNVIYVLNNLIACNGYENIVFNWAMHRQDIIDGLMRGLHLENVDLSFFVLTASDKTIREHYQKDIDAGRRSITTLPNALERNPLFEHIGGTVVNVDNKTVEEVCNEILAHLGVSIN